MSMPKANILLIGSGGVGTMAAYNLEAGGQATVTAVLRSNFDAVTRDGFTITSIDHGDIKGYRPSKMLNSIPNVSQTAEQPFDYIILTTKNTPDIPPTIASLIRPALTPTHTTILLLQNGLNIEFPLITAFPTTPLLSGVSRIGATETSPGHILHDDHDRLSIGSFTHPHLPIAPSVAAAQRFVEMYAASGKVRCVYEANVGLVRWRKLVYNACYNSVCAITRMDTSRMRYYGWPVAEVVRPLMGEVCAIAKAAGFELPEGTVEEMIECDPKETFFKPSMQQDIEKGNYIEFENLVGEPLREAERLGVAAPNLRMVYALLKVLQWNLKEKKGLVSLPVADT